MREKRSPPPVGDACETTLNPGFKWERLDAVGLSATRRTCTPGFRCAPVVVIRDKANVCAGCRAQQRTCAKYNAAAYVR